MGDFIDLNVQHFNSSSETWESVSPTGVLSIRVRHKLNAPSECIITLSNVRGKRAFTIQRGDRIILKASPSSWTSEIGMPPVFYGFVMDIETTNLTYTVVGLDTLGWLTNEIILTNPFTISTRSDGADVLKEIVADSAYSLNDSLAKMLGETRVIMPQSLSVKNNTRLQAMQSVLSLVNSTPRLFRLKGNLSSKLVEFDRLPTLDDTTHVPYIAGRMPRTTAPLDIIPTSVFREESESDLINLVTIQNTAMNISVTEPITSPTNPIHRLFEETMVTDEVSARLFARQIINQQGIDKTRWTVEAIPNRLDIVAGDIIEFQSIEGGLSGKQMVFDLTWTMNTGGCEMVLTVGRQSPDFLTAIRFAAGQSI